MITRTLVRSHKYYIQMIVMIVSDCVLVTSEEGHFYYKATGDESTVCGVYLLTDPDKMVEIYFDYLDVPCQTGGLISVWFSSNTLIHIIYKFN